MTRRTYFGLLATGAAPLAYAANDAADVTRFGVKADGKTDDTAAIQKALDAAAKQGGVVRLPAGKYLVAGSLKIPAGVALGRRARGPAVYIEPLTRHRDPRHRRPGQGGRPRACSRWATPRTVQGLTVFYPEQKPDDIHPYAWTFHLQGGDNTVENVTLINSYNGIRIGPETNVATASAASPAASCAAASGGHLLDIGRIENVQWHCHWWSSQDGGRRLGRRSTSTCGRTAKGSSSPAPTGSTSPTPSSSRSTSATTSSRPKAGMNGQFCGIGADAAHRCIVVEHIQPMGLLITNGQFVAFTATTPSRSSSRRPAPARCAWRTARSGDRRESASSRTARASCRCRTATSSLRALFDEGYSRRLAGGGRRRPAPGAGAARSAPASRTSC